MLCYLHVIFLFCGIVQSPNIIKTTTNLFYALLIIWSHCPGLAYAEIILSKGSHSQLLLSCYADAYYAFSLPNKALSNNESLIYNHLKTNSLATNVSLLDFNYQNKKWKTSIGLMAGDYGTYNLSAEPYWLRFIYQANINFTFDDSGKSILTAGIFPSHIGVESPLAVNNWMLTRSFVAENSPYYESGIKYSFAGFNYSLAVMALNGWQNIYQSKKITLDALGVAFATKLTNSVTLNYNNFFRANNDLVYEYRWYQNLYLTLQKNKLGLLINFDLGYDISSSSKPSVWYAPLMMIKYDCSKTISLAARVENFEISKASQSGFAFDKYSALNSCALATKLAFNKNFVTSIEYRLIKASTISPNAQLPSRITTSVHLIF
ncbi:MAG: hypothetical protein RIQ89_778 [Bacteroidota bacterium]|jgi:hypothetical protein